MTVKELRKRLKQCHPHAELSFQYYPNTEEGWECDFSMQENTQRWPMTVSLFFTPKEVYK